MFPLLPRNSDFRKSLFGAASRSAQTIALNILTVPAMAYIIRKLGPAEYGQWTTAASLVATFGVLTNLGLRGTFVRAVAKDAAEAPRAMAQQLGTRLVLAVLASAVALAAGFALHYPPLILQCIAITAIATIISTAATTASELFEAFQRFHKLAASIHAIVNAFWQFVIIVVSFRWHIIRPGSKLNP
jgi:O-antigen/teichoic acid export membrane protein